MDIERVLQLYPRQVIPGHGILDPQQQGQQRQPGPQPRDTTSPKAEQQPYRVVISGVVTTTIMPTPTGVPTPLSDAEAKELLDQHLRECGESDEPEEIWLEHKRSS